MSVSSAQLRQVAGELRSFATSLGASSAAASTNIDGLSRSIEDAAGTWSGPDPTRVNDGARAYVTAIAGAPGLIDEMQQSVTGLAEYAEAVARDIAGWEGRRAAVDERRRAGTALLDDADAAWIAESRIADLGNTWVYNAGWYALALASHATALRSCCDAVAMSDGHPQPPNPTAYYTMVATFANAEGMALDVIDPTGRLDDVVVSMIEDLRNGELGPFKFGILEVLRQRNLDEQDLILTDNDLGAASFGAALALWRDANGRYNLGLSDGEMELLARETVATALMLHAADDELVETLVINPEPPDIDNIDAAELWNDLNEISVAFDGLGICLEADASGGPALAGGVGTCIVSTDDDLGQIAWHAVGGAVGTSAISAGAGPISTNASNIGQLEGWSVCFTGGGGSGVGASGTMCGGLTLHPDGAYRFNSVVSAQGSIAATSPSAGGQALLVRTYVVWRNGTLNVIREPFEAVGEHATGMWDQVVRGLERMSRPPRFSAD